MSDAINFRADATGRVFVLAPWPTTALIGRGVLGTDNPNIVTGPDGTVMLLAANGVAIYKLPDPLPEGDVLEIALQPGNIFQEPPAEGAEAEFVLLIPDDATLESLSDEMVMRQVRLHAVDGTGTRQGDIDALKAKRDAKPEPEVQPASAETQKQPDPPPAEGAEEKDPGNSYFGPEVAEVVRHEGQEKAVHGTRFHAGKGSFVQFSENGPWIGVDDCQPLSRGQA